VAPSDGRDRGDPVSLRNPGDPKRQQASWTLTSEGRRVRPLEDRIEDIVAFVEEHREAFEALAPNIERRIFAVSSVATMPMAASRSSRLCFADSRTSNSRSSSISLRRSLGRSGCGKGSRCRPRGGRGA
jgi:hypothetical protein